MISKVKNRLWESAQVKCQTACRQRAGAKRDIVRNYQGKIKCLPGLCKIEGEMKTDSVINEQGMWVFFCSKLLYCSSQIAEVIWSQIIFVTLNRGGNWKYLGDLQVIASSSWVGNYCCYKSHHSHHWMASRCQVGWIYSMKKKGPALEASPSILNSHLQFTKYQGKAWSTYCLEAGERRGRRQVCWGRTRGKGNWDGIWTCWISLLIVLRASPQSCLSSVHSPESPLIFLNINLIVSFPCLKPSNLSYYQ